jgi:uncharacterized membrane protein
MAVRAAVRAIPFTRQGDTCGRRKVPGPDQEGGALKATSLIGGIGIGAGLMYFLDPGRGRRRRALVRDKSVGLWNATANVLGKTRRDLGNRTEGISAWGKHLFTHPGGAPAQVLEARVRSKLGRVARHPGSIEVTALPGGAVTLSGPVLQDEVEHILDGVASVEGVRSIENRLEPHTHSENVAGLQGEPRRRPEERFELMQSNWSPAARALVGAAGTTMAFYGLGRWDWRGAGMGVLGAAAIARSLSNKEFKRLTGVRAGRRAVDIQKTLTIDCPVERVFEFWANYENFPKFMSHLREVRDLGSGRSHWVAVGPARIPVEWDAEITDLRPNETLAWRSVPGSRIENAGTVRFQSNPDGSTQLSIRISYNPPAGAVGHGIARMFGAYPEHALNEDLARLKSLLEVGKTSVKGHTVTREKLEGVAKTLVPDQT